LSQDDFWRRNHDTIPALSKFAPDFNPHYPTSIAYTPLPRKALENFLAQRGLFNQKPKLGDWIHNGYLNKLYLRLNETVFTPTTGKVGPFIAWSLTKLITLAVDYVSSWPWIERIEHEPN
jgi:hypothetical protein